MTRLDAPAAARVVLLEDDADISDLIRFVLHHQIGVDAESHTNGREALTAILQDPPQLAILDIAVPELNGSRCSAPSGRTRPRPPCPC